MSTTVEPPEEVQHDTDEYDGYYAYLYNGTNQIHIVDPRTLDNSGLVVTPNGDGYDGYTANLGSADTLCGREQFGRMCPIENEEFESGVCGTCLSALEAREASSTGGSDDD